MYLYTQPHYVCVCLCVRAWAYDLPMTKPAAFPTQFIYVQLNSMWNFVSAQFFSRSPIYTDVLTAEQQNSRERGKQQLPKNALTHQTLC